MIKKYFAINQETQEKFEVLPHTFGDVNGDGKSDVSFVDASLAGTDAWANPEVMYTWTNADQDGAFVNNDEAQLDVTGQFDIVFEEVSEESVA